MSSAAARRRLPMVEVAATIPVTGEHGPVPLLDVFEGRWQLIVYYYMWHPGKRDGDRVYETYWTSGRATEIMAPSYGLLDMTVYGRQEIWEDSPDGWPQPRGLAGAQFRDDGRPPPSGPGWRPDVPMTSAPPDPESASQPAAGADAR